MRPICNTVVFPAEDLLFFFSIIELRHISRGLLLVRIDFKASIK